MSTRYLDKRLSYLFIFNPCINLQLICPCANSFFILINLFVVVFLRAASLRLFLSCHLTLFLSIIRFCVPLEMLEGFRFSGVSRRREIGVMFIFGPINDDLIWLMVVPVYTLLGRWRACSYGAFLGDMELERWPEMGQAQETNTYQQ